MNETQTKAQDLIKKYSPYLASSLEVTIRNTFYNFGSKEMKNLVHALNDGIKIKLQGGLWYYLPSDKPPHLPSPLDPTPHQMVKHGNMRIDPRLAKLGGLEI